MDNQNIDAACDEVFDLSDLLVNIAFTGNKIQLSTLGFDLLFNSLTIACPCWIDFMIWEIAFSRPDAEKGCDAGVGLIPPGQAFGAAEFRKASAAVSV